MLIDVCTPSLGMLVNVPDFCWVDGCLTDEGVQIVEENLGVCFAAFENVEIKRFNFEEVRV